MLDVSCVGEVFFFDPEDTEDVSVVTGIKALTYMDMLTSFMARMLEPPNCDIISSRWPYDVSPETEMGRPVYANGIQIGQVVGFKESEEAPGEYMVTMSLWAGQEIFEAVTDNLSIEEEGNNE